jgi:hypothetical protein
MESFYDLAKSTQFEDKTIHDFFIRLLDALFDQHDHLIIDSNCESEKNKQLIKDQWKLISLYFQVPKRVCSTKKCVRQTLKHIIDNLNERYQFKQPIQFNLKKDSVRVGDTVLGSSHTDFSLI